MHGPQPNQPTIIPESSIQAIDSDQKKIWQRLDEVKIEASRKFFYAYTTECKTLADTIRLKNTFQNHAKDNAQLNMLHFDVEKHQGRYRIVVQADLDQLVLLKSYTPDWIRGPLSREESTSGVVLPEDPIRHILEICHPRELYLYATGLSKKNSVIKESARQELMRRYRLQAKLTPEERKRHLTTLKGALDNEEEVLLYFYAFIENQIQFGDFTGNNSNDFYGIVNFLNKVVEKNLVEYLKVLINYGNTLKSSWLPFSRKRTFNLCLDTAARTAIARNHVDCLRIILKNPDLQVNGSTNGGPWLLLAAQCGATECVHALLGDSRVKVNVYDEENGNSALLKASSRGHLGCVQALLADPRTDVNRSNGNDHSALTLAAAAKQADCLGVLLKHPKIKVSNGDLRSARGFTCRTMLLNDSRIEINSNKVAYTVHEIRDGLLSERLTIKEAKQECRLLAAILAPLDSYNSSLFSRTRHHQVPARIFAQQLRRELFNWERAKKNQIRLPIIVNILMEIGRQKDIASSSNGGYLKNLGLVEWRFLELIDQPKRSSSRSSWSLFNNNQNNSPPTITRILAPLRDFLTASSQKSFPGYSDAKESANTLIFALIDFKFADATCKELASARIQQEISKAKNTFNAPAVYVSTLEKVEALLCQLIPSYGLEPVREFKGESPAIKKVN